MSSWGNYDNAANTPLWAATSVKLEPTSANVSSLYLNTTPNAFIDGETVGLFMVDQNEEDVLEANGNPTAHKGWNLRTEGSGGRAGRVQFETLVALSTVSSDNNSDDTVLPDTKISITSQPTSLSGPVSAASANTITLTVGASIVAGATAPLTYQWQVNNNTGGTWVNVPAGTGVTTGQPGDMIKTGANTATLILDPTDVTANNYVFRAVVTASNTGASATSANARILITA